MLHKYENLDFPENKKSNPVPGSGSYKTTWKYPSQPAETPIISLPSKDFLTGLECTHESLNSLLNLALQLKRERKFGKLRTDCQGKTLALLFEKPSLRTHLSFSLAMKELGGQTVESYSLNRKHEEPEDVARVVGSYCDAIMLRTHEHHILEKMAAFAPVPVINGLSDSHHPCQTLADLLSLQERFGSLHGLKLAYIGDGNNVLHSLLLLLPKIGVSVSYACPTEYIPDPIIVSQSIAIANKTGAKISAFTSPELAAKDANAIYTDVWTSMGFEEESQKREAAFAGFQVNRELYQISAKDAVVMHCLPMERGKEISNEMAEHKNSIIFQQAENRLHAQKALLLMLMKK